MDAHVKLIQEDIDTDQFNPSYISFNEVEYIFGTGQTPNEYIDEFGNTDNLSDYIEQNLQGGYSGGSDFQDYMGSTQYDSFMVSEWAVEAAYQLMEDAKQNYDYLLNVPEEQEMAIQTLSSVLGIGKEPDDILGRWGSESELKDKLMGIEQFREWADTEGLVTIGDEWEEYVQDIADSAYTWAIEGQEKVSGI